MLFLRTRFAIADLYLLHSPGDQFEFLWVVRDFTTPSHKGYGMLLSDILWKLVTALPTAVKQAWFMTCSRQSGL